MRFVSVINRFDFFEGEIAAELLIVGVMRVTAAAVGLPNGQARKFTKRVRCQ